MQYIQTEKNKVKDIFCGPSVPKGMKEVPKNHQFRIGDDVRFFKKDGKRMTPEEAVKAGLIKIGENQKAVWNNGQYKVIDDYTEKEYWNKKTGEQVKLKLGETPGKELTDIKKPDPAMKWEKDEWILPDDIMAIRIREKRDNLLLKTDYLLMPDYPLKEKKEWEEYRQSLRDIPQQTGFPGIVRWPEVPQ